MTNTTLAAANAGDPMVPSADASAPRRPHWKRDISIFLTGRMVSMFGSMLVQYAIMWHLALVTQSGLVLTLSIVFGMLPQAIVSVFGGVWADRVNRKVLIIVADSSIAVSTLVLAVVMLVAPPVAAAVYASLSIIAIFFIDAITAVIGIGLLLSIAVPTIRAIDTSRGYFTDLVEGVRYTLNHQLVRWTLLLLTIVMMLGAAPSYLTPLMIVRTFGADVWLLTLSEFAFAVGMFVAGAIIAVLGSKVTRPVVLAVAMTALFGGLNIGLGFSPTVWIFSGFMFLAGASIPLMSTPLTTMLQLRVEPQLHGRVFGLVGVVMSIAMPVGMIVLGPLSDVVEVEVLLVWSGAITFLAVAVIALMPSGRHALRERIDPAAAAKLGAGAPVPTTTGAIVLQAPADAH